MGKRDGHNQISEDEAQYNKLVNLYAMTDDKDEKKRIMANIEAVKKENEDSLNLGYVLQRLDGIYDETGRVIIACTNHPDKIDPALLRPGRLGTKVKLGNCTAKMMEDIIGYYMCLDETQRKRIRDANLPVDNWPPAEVIQYIQMHYSENDDKDVALGHILEHLSKTRDDYSTEEQTSISYSSNTISQTA